ncbi:MAG: DUF6639 family protein [Pseudomonadota bacterium]
MTPSKWAWQQARPRAGAAVLLLFALCLTPARAATGGAGAQARPCPDGVGAVVTGASDPDLADVCRGVAAALGFFAAHGIRPTELITVEVTPALPAEAGPTAAGCYIEPKRRVFVLPYAVFRKSKTWFGVPIDRSMYQSLASHEAAHAIAACHFSVPNPSIQAEEYLAYVTMFSTMPAALRQRALRATPTQGFDSLDRFTPMLYLFDPMRFGAEAYRHFAKTADPAALIQSVLGGMALRD